MAIINFTREEVGVVIEAVAGHYLAGFADADLKSNERADRAFRSRANAKMGTGDVDLTREEALALLEACVGFYLYDRPDEELTTPEKTRRTALYSAIAKLEPVALA